LTKIIKDTIEEYKGTYTRMRSYEFMAEHDEFSASKFGLHPTKFLKKHETDMINNEMENEVRRKNWLDEARAQVILLRQHQGEPYDQTQQNTWTLDSHAEQTRKMEKCDAIRLEHLPTH
jgi:hypothetical protein